MDSNEPVADCRSSTCPSNSKGSPLACERWVLMVQVKSMAEGCRSGQMSPAKDPTRAFRVVAIDLLHQFCGPTDPTHARALFISPRVQAPSTAAAPARSHWCQPTFDGIRSAANSDTSTALSQRKCHHLSACPLLPSGWFRPPQTHHRPDHPKA